MNTTAITIVPDERMQQLAKDSIQIQDACNGTSVSKLLNRTMCALGKYNEGSDWVNQHPIVKSIINKLEHLADMPQANKIKNYHACMDLADGITAIVDAHERLASDGVLESGTDHRLP